MSPPVGSCCCKRVIKDKIKFHRRLFRRVSSALVNIDVYQSDVSWYRGLFCGDDVFWRHDILTLVRRYILYHLRYFDVKLRLCRDLLSYLSSLILRYGFRAKLQHVHRDINDLVRVLQVSPRLHCGLGLVMRHGISVFHGLCIRGCLSHPRMYRSLDRPTVLLAKSFLNGNLDTPSSAYEDIRDVCGSYESVSGHVERLCKSGVKLLLCSGSVPLELGEKLHLRGICCVCKVDPEVLSKVALAVDRPIVECVEDCTDYIPFLSRIERYTFVKRYGDNIAALTLDSSFHGCSIIYSTVRLTCSNSARLKDLIYMGLFHIQALFEELTLVKDLGGTLDGDYEPCFLPNTCRNSASCRSSLSIEPSSTHLSYESPCSSVFSKFAPSNHGISHINSSRLSKHRNQRLLRYIRIVRGHVAYDWPFFGNVSPSHGKHVYLHFSDWLSHHLLGTVDEPSSVGLVMPSCTDLKSNSFLECFEYFTKSSELCGSVTRRYVPFGIYSVGSFLSDFLVDYGQSLDINKCISSEACSEHLDRHHFHLETSGSSSLHRRLIAVVSQYQFDTGSVISGPFLLMRIRCRICNVTDTVAVHDLTFGRFVHLLLYNNCYVSRCGHALFVMHDFLLRGEGFTLCIHVENVTNFNIGAWFDTPLFNAGLGFLPLSSAGLSTHDRHLQRCWNKLSVLLEPFSDALCGLVPGITGEVPDYPVIDFVLLHLKDRSSMLTQALNNVFHMILGVVTTRFSGCVSTFGLYEELPCRCEFGVTFKSQELDPRNQWPLAVNFRSFRHFEELWEDRNAFGIEVHPLLLDVLKCSFDGRTKFVICPRCQSFKFTSIADFEILNWMYIITSVLLFLGLKLRGLSVALGESVDGYLLGDLDDCLGRLAMTPDSRQIYDDMLSPAASMDFSARQSTSFATPLNADIKTFAEARSPSLVLSLQRTASSHNEPQRTEGSVSYDKVLNRVIEIIDDCLESLRITYIQCISHLLFSQYCSSLDPMHIFMTVRSFFVSMTSLCRSVIGDVMRSPAISCLKGLRVMDSNGVVVVYPSIWKSSSESGAGLSAGNNQGQGKTSRFDQFTSAKHEPASNGLNGSSDIKDSVGGSNYISSDRSCRTVWAINIPEDIYHSIRYYKLCRGSFASGTRSTSDIDNEDVYSLGEYLRIVWNSSATFGFYGAATSSPVPSLGQLMSRMHMGCPKRSESVVCVSYGMLWHVRRDIGNIIASGLLSREYLDQCSSRFDHPISGNLCMMGRCLLSYCKNLRYSLMAMVTSGPRRDAFYDVSVTRSGFIDTSVVGKRRIVGFILNSLLFRYLKRHSRLYSLFYGNSYCVFRSELPSDVLSVRRWDRFHPSLADSPWCAMLRSDIDLLVANELCYWQDAKVMGGIPDPITRDQPIMCSVTEACYGTPVVICNHRLFNYRWCDHDKDYGVIPVMDHIVKGLLLNIGNERDVLRSYIDWTCRYLQATLISRLSIHTMLCYVESQIDILYTFERISELDETCCLSPTFYNECSLSSGGTPLSPFMQSFDEKVSYNLSDVRMVSPRGITALSAGVGAFERGSLPQASAISRCTSLTLSTVNPNYDILVHYPEAFHVLRHYFCGDDISFARSLCRSSRLRCSGGKSGAPLFVSHDGKLMIKLLNMYEFQLLLDSGPRFFEHLLGGGTMLSIPYGLFSIIHRKNGRVGGFLVMQNIDHGIDSGKLTFDLKGISFKRCVLLDSVKDPVTSTCLDVPTLSRCCSVNDIFDIPDHIVLLDQNFKNFTKGCPLRLSESSVVRVFEFLRRDLEFLAHLHVVDYSVLLQLFPSAGVLVLGIIDYLRPYTWDKQIESIGKKLANLASGQAPTIVSPFEYRVRFLRFFVRIFWFVKEEEEGEPSLPRLTKLVKRPPPPRPICQCLICSATRSLYSGRYAISLCHYMWRTSPGARRYIHRLVSSSVPCGDIEGSSLEVSRLLQLAYGTAALDSSYRVM
ncbi:1-phosphatidylinositol 3-phosphate 5-kinase [Babesia sp. Xinjiang]|uniref:1-phosphatidylinositol 3-phosphate 5-kinase n=1 Tax=Babesia sp. Xinjiang TaxID=462227 RepID=UPI000A21F2A3|nr:1-phosphatidylinositol 3-phosphate 5-kinase [Babesia sp. Xinjiang]ORM42382.1 1-phosphatidylinositol 3-phosphate 5-kinase [Babesia sp. Xinjiang]